MQKKIHSEWLCEITLYEWGEIMWFVYDAMNI